jgi:hypothetical protein
MSANFDIPAIHTLAGRDQWVRWKRVWRDDEPTKPPFTVDGRNASTTNPTTWTSFNAVRKAVPTPGHDRGLGFVFTDEDPYVGIDLDGCRDPNSGQIAGWAQSLIDSVASYTEVSPSQTGVKMIVEGTLPQAGRKTEIKDVERLSFKAPAIEMYASARYFTITAEHLDGTPERIESRQAALDALFERFFGNVSHFAISGPVAAEANSPGLSDEQVLELAFRARNGPRVRRLFELGDLSGYADDDSRADQALVSMLAFYTGDDEDQLDRLFRRSALYRDKWERHDYRERTIRRALVSRTAVYQRPTARVTPADEDDAEPVVLAPIPVFDVNLLPAAGRGLVEGSSLPANLIAGGVLAALACAIGGNVDVKALNTWIERLIVWVTLIAPRGAGKSPVREMTYAPIQRWCAGQHTTYHSALTDWRAVPPRERQARPRNTAILRSDSTIEAIYRRLDSVPDTGLVYDELAKLLRGLAANEYKAADTGQSGGADADRLMELWTASAVTYTRVGRGDGTDNQIDLFIARPTVTILGCLQTFRHHLLGADQDGMRPRWLVHVSDMPAPEELRAPTSTQLQAWDDLLTRLLKRRAQQRTWVLDELSMQHISRQRLEWDQRARETDCSPTMAAALNKSATAALRIAATLAEADLKQLSPAIEIVLPREALERAIAWQEFVLQCWAALGERTTLALSYEDRQIDPVVDAIAEYVAVHGEEVERAPGVVQHRLSRDVLRRNRVAGVATSGDLKKVLKRYVGRYPDDVQESEESGSRGPKPTWVYAPRRGGVPITEILLGNYPTHPSQASEQALKQPSTNDSEIDGAESTVNGVVSVIPENRITEQKDGEIVSVIPENRITEQANSPENGGTERADVQLCRACGRPLSAGEQAAGWGLHYACTLPPQAMSPRDQGLAASDIVPPTQARTAARARSDRPPRPSKSRKRKSSAHVEDAPQTNEKPWRIEDLLGE